MSFLKYGFFVSAYLLLSACSSSSWLLVPHEHNTQIKKMVDPIKQREYLYPYPYRVMAVTRNWNGKIKAQQHYRAQHSLTFMWHPVDDPQGYNPGDLLRIKNARPLGFAVKAQPDDSRWDIFWYDKQYHHEGPGMDTYFLPEKPDESITNL